jgi:hypothetical protein
MNGNWARGLFRGSDEEDEGDRRVWNGREARLVVARISRTPNRSQRTLQQATAAIPSPHHYVM